MGGGLERRCTTTRFRLTITALLLVLAAGGDSLAQRAGQDIQIEYVQPRDYAHIAELVRARDPQRIAISDSGNGPMLAALGEYASRTVGSWTLGVRWLETMGPEQISV